MNKFPKYIESKNLFPTLETIDKFKKKYTEYKDVDSKILKKVFQEFANELIDMLINTREGVALPESLGYFLIVACDRPTKKVIDQNHTNRSFINLETDGKLLKIFFDSTSVRYKMKHHLIWNVRLNQVHRRKISEAFKKNWQFYIQTETGVPIYKFYKEDKIRKYNKCSNRNYNELDI